MRVVIATATVPKDFAVFCKIMRETARNTTGDLYIPQGIWFTGGKGCSNLGFDIMGNTAHAENFVNQLTMVLMPAKWTTTTSPLPNQDQNDVNSN